MMDLFLLLIEGTLFVAFSWILFVRERIYGVYFFALFIYAVFSQVGYLYVPKLSMFIQAYFGEAVWRPAAIFIILSGACLFLFLRYCSRPASALVLNAFRHLPVRLYIVDGGSKKTQGRILFVVFVILALQYAIYITRHNALTWANVQSESLASDDRLAWVFMVMLKLSVGMNMALYCSARQTKSRRERRLLGATAAVSLFLFILFTFAVGSRTDVVALGAGILVFETGQFRIRIRHLLAIGLTVSLLYGYLRLIEMHRDENTGMELDPGAQLLLKDYYAPAHMLFAAMAYDYIHPGEVIRSNASNALFLLNYPYLQACVTDVFLPGVTTRSQSFGFYIFTEGYMVLGFAGCLYNGIVIGVLLSAWRMLATTRVETVNRFLLALVGTELVNVVRGQTSYFIKFGYMYFVPATIIFLLLNHKWMRVKTSLAIFRDVAA